MFMEIEMDPLTGSMVHRTCSSISILLVDRPVRAGPGLNAVSEEFWAYLVAF